MEKTENQQPKPRIFCALLRGYDLALKSLENEIGSKESQIHDIENDNTKPTETSSSELQRDSSINSSLNIPVGILSNKSFKKITNNRYIITETSQTSTENALEVVKSNSKEGSLDLAVNDDISTMNSELKRESLIFGFSSEKEPLRRSLSDSSIMNNSIIMLTTAIATHDKTVKTSRRTSRLLDYDEIVEKEGTCKAGVSKGKVRERSRSSGISLRNESSISIELGNITLGSYELSDKPDKNLHTCRSSVSLVSHKSLGFSRGGDYDLVLMIPQNGTAIYNEVDHPWRRRCERNSSSVNKRKLLVDNSSYCSIFSNDTEGQNLRMIMREYSDVFQDSIVDAREALDAIYAPEKLKKSNLIRQSSMEDVQWLRELELWHECTIDNNSSLRKSFSLNDVTKSKENFILKSIPLHDISDQRTSTFSHLYNMTCKESQFMNNEIIPPNDRVLKEATDTTSTSKNNQNDNLTITHNDQDLGMMEDPKLLKNHTTSKSMDSSLYNYSLKAFDSFHVENNVEGNDPKRVTVYEEFSEAERSNEHHNLYNDQDSEEITIVEAKISSKNAESFLDEPFNEFDISVESLSSALEVTGASSKKDRSPQYCSLCNWVLRRARFIAFVSCISSAPAS